jgi:very-short-patch-repair endonuclease
MAYEIYFERRARAFRTLQLISNDMKRAIFYGVKDKKIPWVDGFQICSDGSLKSRISGINLYEINDQKDEVTWFSLFQSEKHNLLSEEELQQEIWQSHEDPFAFYYGYRERMWDKLLEYCHPKSKAERIFFEMYCRLCFYDNGEEAFLPALIPCVYLNWYLDKEERQENSEPYIVDFVFKSPAFRTNDIVVIEIDGPSHYADYTSNADRYIVSEKRYAEHLLKDRWLRKNGFKVFRIGNYELERITKLDEKEQLKEFYFFFVEMFGSIIAIDRYNFPEFFPNE